MKWTYITAAALGLLTANEARATTYIKYDFLTQGGGLELFGTTIRPIQNFSFSFVVPVDGGRITKVETSSSTSITFLSTFGQLTPADITLLVRGTMLSLTQSQPVLAPGSAAFAFNACLPQDVGGVLPTSNIATDRTCGSVSYSEQQRGFSRIYSGRVVEIHAAAFEGTGAFTGLVGINSAVPEPTTWAMLVIGMGMMGFAVRRRPRAAQVMLA